MHFSDPCRYQVYTSCRHTCRKTLIYKVNLKRMPHRPIPRPCWQGEFFSCASFLLADSCLFQVDKIWLVLVFQGAVFSGFNWRRYYKPRSGLNSRLFIHSNGSSRTVSVVFIVLREQSHVYLEWGQMKVFVEKRKLDVTDKTLLPENETSGSPRRLCRLVWLPLSSVCRSSWGKWWSTCWRTVSGALIKRECLRK